MTGRVDSSLRSTPLLEEDGPILGVDAVAALDDLGVRSGGREVGAVVGVDLEPPLNRRDEAHRMFVEPSALHDGDPVAPVSEAVRHHEAASPRHVAELHAPRVAPYCEAVDQASGLHLDGPAIQTTDLAICL